MTLQSLAGSECLDATALVPDRGCGPWSTEHVVRLVVSNAVGLGLIFAGSWQAFGTDSVRSALAWLDLSISGVIVAGFANGLWFLRGREAVTLARLRVLSPGPGLTYTYPVDEGLRSSGNGHGALVAVPGLDRFHRAECGLVTGKQAEVAARAAHLRLGRIACEVCEP